MYVKENKRNNEMKQEKEKRNGKREEKNFYTASIRDLIVDIHIALVICVDESFFRINVYTCGYEMLEMHNPTTNYFRNFLKYFYE